MANAALRREVRFRIAAYTDVCDIRSGDACDVEAFLDCSRGKPRPVLYASETLLFDCDNELAIAKEYCATISVIRVNS